MYREGKGVTPDLKRAAVWYAKAAEQGLAAAQVNLGSMYWDGEGVPQDYARAMELFVKAAEKGLAEAQYNLGVMYREGLGVPKNSLRAYMWFDLAGRTDEEAARARDSIASGMTQHQIDKAKRWSRQWKPER